MIYKFLQVVLSYLHATELSVLDKLCNIGLRWCLHFNSTVYLYEVISVSKSLIKLI